MRLRLHRCMREREGLRFGVMRLDSRGRDKRRREGAAGDEMVFSREYTVAKFVKNLF